MDINLKIWILIRWEIIYCSTALEPLKMCRVVLQTLETPFNGLWTQDKDENYVIFCSAASDPKGVGGSAAGLEIVLPTAAWGRCRMFLPLLLLQLLLMYYALLSCLGRWVCSICENCWIELLLWSINAILQYLGLSEHHTHSLFVAWVTLWHWGMGWVKKFYI